jgi:nucleoside 2-deoxyribosyltransferase
VKIYLAGPIHGCTDLDCRAWRGVARSYIESAGHEVLDPMERDYRGSEEEYSEDLVADDKEDIECADAVLVNANRPSWGTAMEVMYAVSFGKKVVAFATYTLSPTISPWLRCHCDAIFGSIDTAIAGMLDGSAKGMR